MDIIVTALTEKDGRIRHHLQVTGCTHVEDLLPHLCHLFRLVYAECGDFVIIKIEHQPLLSSGVYQQGPTVPLSG